MDEPQKNRFSDVIGGLVSSIANARSVADIEAMRIAYYYYQHELLKGIPIPRLRIQRVSISLPIIVSEIIPGVAAVRNPASDVAKSATDALRKAIAAAKMEFDDIKSLKSKHKIILSQEEKDILGRIEKMVDQAQQEEIIKRFNSQLTDNIEHAYVELNLAEGDKPSDASLRDKVGQVAEKVFREIFSENISKYVQEKAKAKKEEFDLERAYKTIQVLMDHEITTRLISLVRHAAEGNAVRSRTIPPDFYVSVNTGEIKNAGGGPDVVTRLEMVLREEGLEWLTEEHEGKITSKLTQE